MDKQDRQGNTICGAPLNISPDEMHSDLLIHKYVDFWVHTRARQTIERLRPHRVVDSKVWSELSAYENQLDTLQRHQKSVWRSRKNLFCRRQRHADYSNLRPIPRLTSVPLSRQAAGG